MKSVVSIFSSIILLQACNSARKDNVRSFMPGTYVRFSDHEMRKEYDTIKIEMIRNAGSSYRLTRSSQFQKKLDGQTFPWKYKVEEWTAIYNENQSILNESKKGKVISFVPEKHRMMVGATEYRKIK